MNLNQNNNYLDNYTMNKVEKTKATKQRNRDIKELKKVMKTMNDKDIKTMLDGLKKEKTDYFKEQKKIAKDKLIHQKAIPDILKITGYGPSHIKKDREARIKKLDDKYKYTGTRQEVLKVRDKHEKKALDGSFHDIIIRDELFFDRYYDSEVDELNDYFGKIAPHFISILETEIMKILFNNSNGFNLLVNIVVEFVMFQYVESEKKYSTFYYNSVVAEKIFSKNQIREWAKNEFHLFVKRVDELLTRGSGWIFQNINYIKIQIQKSKKTKAGSYIATPTPLKLKHALVNINNKDNKCILWCLASSKHYHEITHNKKSEASTYKKYLDEIIEPKDIIYPIDIQTDIKKFERLNNIKINVFEYDSNDYTNLNTLYNTKSKNSNVCNLLLLREKEKEHLVWIKDLSKLLRMDSNHEKRYWCSQCLSCSFSTQDKLDYHQILCYDNEAVHSILPHEGYTDEKIGKEIKANNKIFFKNENNQFKHPFSVYLDFESTLKPLEDKGENTNKYQEHIVNSVGLKYNCIHDDLNHKIDIYNNEDPEKVLEYTINKLEDYALESYNNMKKYEKKYILTDIEKVKHYSCKTCNKCNVEFNEENKKVLHHDHLNGKYISTLCNECNLLFQYKKFLPVYAHNLKGYDSHFLITALNSHGYQSKESDLISAIPNNEEKYISFSKKIKVDEYKKFNKETKEYEIKPIMFEIRFLDTIAFMASSLCKLVENLKNSNMDNLRKAFKNTSEHFTNDADFFLMIQKGIYPYDYITDFNKLNDTELPSQKDFYSKLSDEECNDKDYNRALIVWKHFNCKNMLDYHNLYLITDVLLLADIFENFKDICYKIYGLDASYYYTAPGLSWDSFLKHTNDETMKKENKRFEIELIIDMDKYLFIEKGIRGGLSQISKRYAKANNKYMSNYNDKKTDEYILYLDANNLYGYAMSSFLPQSDFQWDEGKWNTDKILALDNEGEYGYTLEVDTFYPKELHDYHNGYALASSNEKIKTNMLNDWQQEGYHESNIKKLITNFEDKKNYIINYRLLKLFIQLGLEIPKIHRVLRYKQNDYMKSYIMKNTDMRSKSNNDFEKDFYKLMNNSVYGKTMENVRNRINFRLISSEEQALRIRNTRIKYTIFNKNLVGVHLCKQQVTLNKPIFIGQNVLDESKLLMYDFHYNFMLKKIDRNNIDLLMTDTDSLVYHIRKQDPFEIIKNNKDQFDLSNYPKDHELYNPKNKAVIGKFKNESISQITEFVGLRSKLYAYTTDDDREHQKCKGVKKCAMKKQITFNNYKTTLFNRQTFNISQNGIRSYKHKLYSETVNKTCLSFNDDKCYILNDNILTYTHNHYKISK